MQTKGGDPVEFVNVECHCGKDALRWIQDMGGRRLPPLCELEGHPADDWRWCAALSGGLRQTIYLLLANDGEQGALPLAFVRSRVFGRFLVSLPYINTGGVRAASGTAARLLLDRAIVLADELDVDYLELRHEQPILHPKLITPPSAKVHCRLALPADEDEVLAMLRAKVRNQVNRGREADFQVQWGGAELLADFYRVFARNMRDLGSPVFGKSLFDAMLGQFRSDAELCVLRLEGRPVGGAMLVHGEQVTEVPSASCLREYNRLNTNMFMYWRLLCRAVERGSRYFDFGRSTIDSGAHKFKRQWRPEETFPTWQYYVRRGEVGGMKKESAKFAMAIRLWQRLPLWAANRLGPPLARCIP